MFKLKLFITGSLLSYAVMVNAAGFDKKVFDSVIETVRENSRYEISDDEIYRGAVQGLMQMLEEKNTQASSDKKDRQAIDWNDRNVLLNPAQTENLEINTRGSFAGVGLVLQYKPEEGIPNPVINEVIEGGGGKRAGLQKEDQILKINGRPSAEFETLGNMVNEIRGPAGSKVSLTLLRQSNVIDVEVTREIIKIAVLEARILPGRIGYLKLNNFTETAAREFKQELENFSRENVGKIILDLRDNAGGLFQTSTEIMGYFMKRNAILFQEQKKSGAGLRPFKTDKEGVAADMQVVVLVNENTRSVAEAMASIFKHRKNSTVIGARTFGKASVEEMFDLNNNYRLLMTVGMLYDSDGNTWHGTGIRPNIVVPETKDGTDNVMDLAMDYIQRM